MKNTFIFKNYSTEIRSIVNRHNATNPAYKWHVKAINQKSIVLYWGYEVSFKITAPEILYDDIYLMKSVCDYGYGFNSDMVETWLMSDIGDKWSDYLTMDSAVIGTVKNTIKKACNRF